MTDQRRIYQELFTVADASIDVQGHVNNREYLRWMEGVATRHAALLGWDFETLKVRNRSWVAREHWIEYLQPCFAGDELTITTWVQSLRGPASLRRYVMQREGMPVMAGATEWVFIDLARRRPAFLDPDIEATFTLIEPGNAELKALGVDRSPRWKPAPSLLGED